MKLSMLRRKPKRLLESPATRQLAEARLRLSTIDRSKDTQAGGFEAWEKEVSPQFNWDLIHLVHTRFYLDMVTAGHINKVMFFLPPRHGKTEQGSIHYGGFRLERDPKTRIMLVAHTQKYANRVSRQMRKLIEQRVEMNKYKRAAGEWETAAGGGLNAFGALGVGGGLGFDLIIGDDLIKNAKQANSPTYRENLLESYQRDIKTRLNPGGAMILTFTRWHQQDIGGMLLDGEEAKDWIVVKLPALAEVNDPLGRKIGAALWPERWGRRYLLSLKASDPNGFESLYQQNPMPPGGDMFKSDWFHDPDYYVYGLPAGCSYVRYWDKAGTRGGDGAQTAGVLMARTPEGQYIVCDVVLGRWDAGERERHIKRTAELDGPNVTIWLEQEPGSGGKESAENTIRMLAGWSCFAEVVKGEKKLRAIPLAGQAAIANVKLLKDTPIKRWNGTFLAELFSFPQGKLNDQVDAASGAFNKLALNPAPAAAEVSGPRVGIPHNPNTGLFNNLQVWRPDTHIWRPEYADVYQGF